MKEKVLHNETSIKITHSISVDSCISEEIEKLNNEHDVFTLSSCCGHGDAGYIIVPSNDIQKMINLGYGMTTSRYLDNDITTIDKMITCSFKPMSACKCHVID